ncbi:MAG: sigma-70 family RNA polymerase sigma factor [Prosthecobacter sp.]
MPFPETRWSMLEIATASGDTVARVALDDLCRRYWQPVFAVIRSREASVETARDRTQAFFASLLEKSTLRRADKARGRFRTFLLTVLWRFLRDERDRDNAEKRGGDAAECTLEDAEQELIAEENPLAETLDREWALMMLERAVSAVQSEVVASRGNAAWQVLRAFLPGSTETPDLAIAAKTLGIGEGSVRTEVHRLRKRCREALRRELMSTVSSPDELDDEIAYLGRVLRRIT